MRKDDLTKIDFNRILVISLGGFGDTIMATPLFKLLHQKYPTTKLTALTMWSSSAVAIQHLDVFNNIIAHNFLKAPLKDSLKLLYRLRQQCFDLSILTYPSNRAHYNLLSQFINARYRIGHSYLAGNSISYCRFLLTHLVSQNEGTHNVEENLKLAEILGIKYDAPLMSVGTLGMDQNGWVYNFLAHKSPPFFGIHPGCSPLKNHTNRRWPAEKFASLSKELMHKTGGTALVFLGPDEIDLEQTILSLAPKTQIISQTGLERVAALIRRCHLFISSDSSLGHLAAACGIPVVSILGPTNSEHIKPWGVSHRIVSLGLECSPCFEVSRKPLQCNAKNSYSCIRDISVDRVLEACTSLFEKTYKVSARRGTHSFNVSSCLSHK